MTRLAKSDYDRAVNYLKDKARPLERARYAYHFEGGSAADLLDALAAFQNEDGGFGHGLEPDFRLGDSSVIATTLAFQTFRELGTASDHPMVVRACHYMNATYDAAAHKWPIVPPNVDDAPHAPWWTYDGELQKSMANPRAEIVGYLYDYAEHFPAALRQELTDAVLSYLLAQPDTLEMHDLFCYLRLSETEGLPAENRARLMDKLKRIVDHSVETRREGWAAYGLPPLAVVASPESPFAEGLEEAIEQNLDFIMAAQTEQGAWMPNWSWGERWPEAWAEAQREWSGVITLGNLLTLKRFGRLPD